MAKIILTGVDNSETARKASEKAASLAAALGAELHIVSAFSVKTTETMQAVRSTNEPSAMSEAYRTIVGRYSSAAKGIASAAADHLRTNFPHLKIVHRAVEGSPGVVLNNEAEQIDADIIVVGNKRVQGPTRILGSVAKTVASEATCDLFIVNTHRR